MTTPTTDSGAITLRAMRTKLEEAAAIARSAEGLATDGQPARGLMMALDVEQLVAGGGGTEPDCGGRPAGNQHLMGDDEQRAHLSGLDLPHSDGCFVRAYPAPTAEAWGNCLAVRILPDAHVRRSASGCSSAATSATTVRCRSKSLTGTCASTWIRSWRWQPAPGCST
jgi:hypothetical protein